jgi:hypothetical protein
MLNLFFIHSKRLLSLASILGTVSQESVNFLFFDDDDQLNTM